MTWIDRFHWLGRSLAMRLHGPVENGEGFRAGYGWGALHGWGCRVAEEGGNLAFTLPPELRREPIIIAVRLMAPREVGCSFAVGTERDELAAGERRTVVCPVESCVDDVVTLRIAGMASGRATPVSNLTVGVEGFAVHRASR